MTAGRDFGAEIDVLRRVVGGLTGADVRTDAEVEQAEKDAAAAEKQLEADQKKAAKETAAA